MDQDIQIDEYVGELLKTWKEVFFVVLTVFGSASGVFFFWGRLQTSLGRLLLILAVVLIFAGAGLFILYRMQKTGTFDYKMYVEAAEGFMSVEDDLIDSTHKYSLIRKTVDFSNITSTSGEVIWTEEYEGWNPTTARTTKHFITKYTSEDTIRNGLEIEFSHCGRSEPISNQFDEAEDGPHITLKHFDTAPYQSKVKLHLPEEYHIEPGDEFKLTIRQNLGTWDLNVGNYLRYEFNEFEKTTQNIECVLKLSKAKSTELEMSDQSEFYCRKFVNHGSVISGFDLVNLDMELERDLTDELLDNVQREEDTTVYTVSDSGVSDSVYVIGMFWDKDRNL